MDTLKLWQRLLQQFITWVLLPGFNSLMLAEKPVRLNRGREGKPLMNLKAVGVLWWDQARSPLTTKAQSPKRSVSKEFGNLLMPSCKPLNVLWKLEIGRAV